MPGERAAVPTKNPTRQGLLGIIVMEDGNHTSGTYAFRTVGHGVSCRPPLLCCQLMLINVNNSKELLFSELIKNWLEQEA